VPSNVYGRTDRRGRSFTLLLGINNFRFKDHWNQSELGTVFDQGS
jgi:hypothetical protein